MKKPETKFKEIVLADLKTLKNIWFFKTQEVAVHGIPDIIGCLNSFFISLELKKDDKEDLDELQKYNLNKISTVAGGIALKVTPKTWPEIFLKLKVLDQNPRG